MVIKSLTNLWEDTYRSWRKVPHQVKVEMWRKFRTLCSWDDQYEGEIQANYQEKARERVKDIFCECRRKGTKPSFVNQVYWNRILEFYATAEGKKASETAKKNRSSNKGGSLHTCGSVSIATTRLKMELNEGGHVPVHKVYRVSHTSKPKNGEPAVEVPNPWEVAPTQDDPEQWKREKWVEPRAYNTYYDFGGKHNVWRSSQPSQGSSGEDVLTPALESQLWGETLGGHTKRYAYGLVDQAETSGSNLGMPPPIMPFMGSFNNRQDAMNNRVEELEREVAMLKKLYRNVQPSEGDSESDDTE